MSSALSITLTHIGLNRSFPDGLMNVHGFIFPIKAWWNHSCSKTQRCWVFKSENRTQNLVSKMCFLEYAICHTWYKMGPMFLYFINSECLLTPPPFIFNMLNILTHWIHFPQFNDKIVVSLLWTNLQSALSSYCTLGFLICMWSKSTEKQAYSLINMAKRNYEHQ